MTSSPWAWRANPETWLLVAALLFGYIAAVTYVGPKRAGPGEPVATTAQKAAFLLGLLTLWIAEDWPLHEFAEDYLFAAHMIQHIMFTLIAPPLLLLGLPRWMLRTVLMPGRAFFRIVRFLTHPLIALVLFNGVIVAMHLPPIVNLQSESTVFHLFFHAALLGSALCMWWVVVAPLPELNRLSAPGKMLYLFLQSIVPTVPSSFLTFATNPLYEFYERAPRVWGISAATDQMLAGLIMKLGGGLLLWGVITVMFFRWSAREEAADDQDVSWEDFELELEAWNLRK